MAGIRSSLSPGHGSPARPRCGRAAFPNLAYFYLERPDVREFASSDPLGFLAQCGEGAVLDEIQRVPELSSYIQATVDDRKRNGQFVLTGSRQLRVSEAVSQSLAGRTAILPLLPFSIQETREGRAGLTADTMIFTGFYPRIYVQALEPTRALGDYFETYVERDESSTKTDRERSLRFQVVHGLLVFYNSAARLEILSFARDINSASEILFC